MKLTTALAALGTTLATGSAVALYYAHNVEPKQIDITQVALTLPRLAPAFDGYRLVQMSDLHVDQSMTYARLLETVRLINRQQPDLVAITGDFVSHHVAFADDELIDALSQLQAPDGVVAVLGNHDHRSGAARVRTVLAAAGVTELPNEVHSIVRGEAALYVCGVDDIWAREPRLDEILERLPAQGAAILLAHEPEFADVSAAAGRFDLQLSGHSHGGQIHLPIPGLWALVAPSHSKRYRAGRFDLGGMQLYVNRGLGTIGLPLRFNCPPEITVFTLHAPLSEVLS